MNVFVFSAVLDANDFDVDPVSLRHVARFAIMTDTVGKPSTSSILLC